MASLSLTGLTVLTDGHWVSQQKVLFPDKAWCWALKHVITV